MRLILTDTLNIKCGDVIELEIEKLTFQGSGLGRINNLAVFVENSCPEDVLSVRITKLNKSYALARIVEIVKPSPHRVKAHCAISNACGGCCWGFIDYNFTLQQKKLIVQEALRGVKNIPEVLDVLKSPDTLGFRHKIQYPIRQTKVSKRILAGYFKAGSHEIVNVKHCPIQPKIVDEIIDFVRNEWTLEAYNEKKNSGLLKHVAIRLNLTGNEALMTLVLNYEKLKDKELKEIEAFVNKLQAKFPIIVGVSLNFNPGATNTILGKNSKLLTGVDHIFEKLSSKTYKIGADSFFQTNPKCAVALFDVAKSFVNEDSVVLDAYGGVGAFGVWVSDKAKNVVLVEENENAVRNAKENFKLNNVKKYEVFLGDAKVCFNKFLIKKRNFDHVILDPPRKGCDKKVLELISKLTDSIIYVSCNPQTLSRDIKILEEKGFACKKIQPVDMFPHSYHIECVALIEKMAQ